MEGVNLDGKNDQCESVKDQCTSEIKARHNPGEIYFTLILLLINVAFLMESFKMEGIFQRSYNKGGFLPQTISIISITILFFNSISLIFKGLNILGKLLNDIDIITPSLRNTQQCALES
jgi:hypothetical protein